MHAEGRPVGANISKTKLGIEVGLTCRFPRCWLFAPLPRCCSTSRTYRLPSWLLLLLRRCCGVLRRGVWRVQEVRDCLVGFPRVRTAGSRNNFIVKPSRTVVVGESWLASVLLASASRCQHVDARVPCAVSSVRQKEPHGLTNSRNRKRPAESVRCKQLGAQREVQASFAEQLCNRERGMSKPGEGPTYGPQEQGWLWPRHRI